MIWVVVESALMCSGNARNRGRLLAAYMMVYYLGTVLGQLLVSKLPTGLMEVLPWATGPGIGGYLPLLFTRIVSGRNEQQGSTRSGLCCACVRRGWG
jgi:UMF2 family putative MFS family transporter